MRATASRTLLIPFFFDYIQAGFPSPAENYIERVCDLNDLCVAHPEATFFVRVASDSMLGDRIDRDDWLIVDCSYGSREETQGRIVVVWVNGDYTVKRIRYVDDNLIVLESSNEKYTPIYIHQGDNFKVIGLVTFAFQKLK